MYARLASFKQRRRRWNQPRSDSAGRKFVRSGEIRENKVKYWIPEGREGLSFACMYGRAIALVSVGALLWCFFLKKIVREPNWNLFAFGGFGVKWEGGSNDIVLRALDIDDASGLGSPFTISLARKFCRFEERIVLTCIPPPPPRAANANANATLNLALIA
ncbi:hypothetical protein B0H11DRAFT_1898329 [Mycena galericulata]|nr:hypothetical protein B0H11DRAFT_1898329 [Mycena galericulata]